MRKLVAKALGALVVCTFAPFDWVASIERAQAAEQLSGDMLKQNIPGAKIQLDTPLGSVIPVSYGVDGTLEGRAGAVAFFLGSQKDRGKWWIEGSKLCHRWNTWFNRRTSCVRVYQEADNRISWIDQDGDRGTGTIVALNPVAKAEPAAPAEVRAPEKAEPAQRAVSQPARPVVVRPAVVAQALPRAVAAPPPKRAMSTPPAPAKKPGAEEPKPVQFAQASQMMHVAAPPATAAAPRPDAFAPTYRVINVPFDDVLNIRSEPSAYAPIVATIPPRAKGIAQAGDCAGEWCPVRHAQSTGWVHRYFITADRGARVQARGRASPNPITYRVVRVAANDVLNLRRKPHAEAPVVGTIPPNGNRIRLTGYCVGEWCPVAHGRKSGWAHRHYLTLEF